MIANNTSATSVRTRLWGSCPGLAPPGRELTRFSFLSVEGRLGRPSENPWQDAAAEAPSSINSSLLSCCKSVPIHTVMDSDIVAHGKGVSNYLRRHWFRIVLRAK